MANFKKYCKACLLREACEYTFAKYWIIKSANGEGCDYPVGDDRWAAAVINAKRIEECAEAVKPKVVNEAKEAMAKADILTRINRMKR